MITSIEMVDTRVVVHVSGRIDAATTQDFEKSVFEGIEKGNSDIIIDFQGLEYISSAGLRSLLFIAKRMKELTRNVVLCGMNENIVDVIRITGFLTLFYTAPDLKTALLDKHLDNQKQG